MNSNFIQGSVTGGGASLTSIVTNFAAGDVVTITVTRAAAGSGTFRIYDSKGANLFVGGFIYLVATMRPDNHDGYDDGAVV